MKGVYHRFWIIRRVVEDYYDLTGGIEIKTRKRDVCRARQIVMYHLRRRSNGSLAYIGALCGSKDHATVSYAIRCIEERISKVNGRVVDPEICEAVEVTGAKIDRLIGSLIGYRRRCHYAKVYKVYRRSVVDKIRLTSAG